MLNTQDRANMKIIPTKPRESLPRFHQMALQSNPEEPYGETLVNSLLAMKELFSYIYIYIYIYPQTDYFIVSQLFSVAKNKMLQAGIKTWLTLHQSDILHQSHHHSQHEWRNCFIFLSFYIYIINYWKFSIYIHTLKFWIIYFFSLIEPT